MSNFDMMDDDSPGGVGNGINPYAMEPGIMSFDPDGSFEAQHAHVAAEEDEGQFMNPQSFTEYDEGEGAEDSDDAVWCICRKSAGGFMIECEACNEWYHGKCIGIDAELGARIDHFTCHRCNNATVKENLELVTTALLSTKRGTRRRGDRASNDSQMQVSEESTDKERKPQERSHVAIKKSAAVPERRKPVNTTITKKRPHEEVEAEATVPKKPKIREPVAATTMAKPRGQTQVSSHSLTASKARGFDRHRVSFKNSILDVLHLITEMPEYLQAVKEEMVNMKRKEQIETKSEDQQNIGKSVDAKGSVAKASTATLVPPSPNETLLTHLSEEIEQEWFVKCDRRSDDPLYTEQLRSLRFSLKNNPSLVARLILKLLTPAKLATMTPEEMAPSNEREALESLRAQDEMNRNKAAESEGEKRTAKELFHLRGRTDDRILPTAPTFAVPHADDDDHADALLIDNTLKTSGTLSSSTTIATGHSTAEPEKKLSESDLLPVDSALPLVTDPSIIFKQTTPILPTSKVELDLDAFNVPAVSVRETPEEPPSTLPQYPSFAPVRPPTINRGESDVQSGIRSILNEIALDTGGELPSASSTNEAGPTPTQSSSTSSLTGNHATDSFSTSDKVLFQPRGFTITEPEEDHRKVGSPTPDIWRGRLTYEGVLPTLAVSLTAISGFRVDKVLNRIGLTSIDITRIVDTEKILAYLPQLDSSSSRLKSLLRFDPPANDPDAAKSYQEFFSHLHAISRTGVIAIKGAIATEGVLREVYVVPRKAGDTSHPSVFPSYLTSSSEDRLYLSLVSDKKAWEKLNVGLTGEITKSSFSGASELTSSGGDTSSFLGGSSYSPNPYTLSPSRASPTTQLSSSSIIGGPPALTSQMTSAAGPNLLGGPAYGVAYAPLGGPLGGPTIPTGGSSTMTPSTMLGGRYPNVPLGGPTVGQGSALGGPMMPAQHGFPRGPASAPSHSYAAHGKPPPSYPPYPSGPSYNGPATSAGNAKGALSAHPPPYGYPLPSQSSNLPPAHHNYAPKPHASHHGPQYPPHPSQAPPYYNQRSGFPPYSQPPHQGNRPTYPNHPPSHTGGYPPQKQNPPPTQGQAKGQGQAPPSSSASNAAMYFLDSLKGVDLDNLLGPTN
jgi:hypothetical protein